jgi:hypothetical protein
MAKLGSLPMHCKRQARRMVPESIGIVPVRTRMRQDICGKEKGPDRYRPGPKSWERMPERHYLYGATQQIVQVLNVVSYNLFQLSHISNMLNLCSSILHRHFKPLRVHESPIDEGIAAPICRRSTKTGRDLALSRNP